MFKSSMTKREIRLVPAILLLSTLILSLGCDKVDENQIPYGLEGMKIYILDKNSGEEHLVGTVEATYTNWLDTLKECRTFARKDAELRGMKNYDYWCCTMTSYSDCKTKVQ